ncbi:putative manganese transporter [Pseudoalteromonas sp. DL2-H2.2]|uniref:putative manganese transporter n=1 Tax=Pseudoalteromonas sp. DL2-H2.2 TaxID=2908889 RepID=UPI001F2D14F1|nr:putative manganese transporter [Pseudoalteromonas sp. DL2-H2.2]MCF2909445.1 putative manganese transporter [Pseudoalteromonas sp. DL2-H2.2]
MLSQSYSTTTKRSSALSSLLANKRLLLPMLICLALLFDPLRTLTIATLADAFFQVSVFVAGTLAIYYFLIDRLPQLELSYLKARSPLLEISMAAILGALPGCGGAIIVVTQFTKGQASFASVVAVLTATMGDAAFLLLAKKPLEGLTIIALGVAVGIVSGLVVNMLHKPEFCQPNRHSRTAIECKTPPSAIRFSEPVWRWVLLPCVVIALLIAFNTDLGILTKPVELAGAALALFALTIWALSSKGQSYREVTAEDDEQDPPSKLAKVIHDTHFVTAWVVASFMLYELSVALFGLDLAAWFSEYAVFAPLIAIAIGMLPGCGPQIVVTSLYIQGVLPFSALAANAIANDGDALFPALALAPRAAALATLYSAIPALLVGYGLYYFS